MNIKYFFMKDQIDSCKMEVEHCNTDEMTSNYMSKPLVGAKFYKFKNQIMNLPGTTQDSDADTDTMTTCDSSKDKQTEQFFKSTQKETVVCILPTSYTCVSSAFMEDE